MTQIAKSHMSLPASPFREQTQLSFGDRFQEGRTIVTFVATDAEGNQAACEVIVIVIG